MATVAIRAWRAAGCIAATLASVFDQTCDLESHRRQRITLRLVLLVMRIAPRTFTRVYMRFRPPTTAETVAARS